MDDCEHCWHFTGKGLPVSPPIYVDRCCLCHEERQRTAKVARCKHGHAHPLQEPQSVANYLRANLRIEFDTFGGMSEFGHEVKLLLEGEVISSGRITTESD